MLPLQELQTEQEILHRMTILLAAKEKVPAVHFDLVVSVSGSRVVISSRKSTVLRPCLAVTPACRMVLRFLAQATLDTRRSTDGRGRCLGGNTVGLRQHLSVSCR
ncbi:uncharacterized protein LOC127011797 isoform X2 [Drosophila biarmipes]|uniref:uncharacterized protein LOC127011797 isoform X2 n=1 Tax=Drosophila biarmipes TaxID=125945 RepID=UPI0021CCF4F0|nr:uncharacterized protein LOC127011797 isoform X2 [Drosophila biarmipes]